MEEILRFEHVSYAYEEEREALLDVCVKVCAASAWRCLAATARESPRFSFWRTACCAPVRDASCFGARRWAAAQSS